MKKQTRWAMAVMIVTGGLLAGCGANQQANNTQSAAASPAAKEAPKASANTEGGGQAEKVTLTIGGYSVIKDAFEDIYPLFQAEWKKKTGQTVEFKESYQGSGSQATAIMQGFEADIAALSLEGDIDKIVSKGLITSDWKQRPHNGMITSSIAVIGTREGNPKQIKDWSDLAKPGVEVLIPNPSTSGGAKWDINAIYGAGLKASEEQGGKADPKAARDLLANVYKNIKSLDKSGADSMATFNKGVGDAIVSYENELLASNAAGAKYEEVIPKYTIAIENPAAVVDKYVDKHGTRKVAEAFLDYLWSPEAQQIFAKRGFRPVDADMAKQFASKYQTPQGLFDIQYLGGWSEVQKTIYDKGAIWDQIVGGGK